MKLSRRLFLAAGAASSLLPSKETAHLRAQAARETKRSRGGEAAFISEITMAAPDIVRIEVVDAPVTKYPPLGPLQTADPGRYCSEIYPRSNPAENGANWTARVLSLSKRWLKFLDKKPTGFLDRTAALTAANWAPLGGLTVTKIYYSARPNGQFYSSPTGRGHVLGTTTRHHIYLQLSGSLAQGSFKLVNDVAGLNAFFSWNENSTRCCAIRASMSGHRPGDISKQAYLSIWIPGHRNEGAVDFLKQYNGIRSFNLIDQRGNITWSQGEIRERTTPSTVEQGQVLIHSVSTAVPPKTVATVTGGNPTKIVTTTPHGFVTGQVKHFRGFALAGAALPNGMSIEHQSAIITVTGPDSFTVPINTTGQRWSAGSYLAGYDGLVLDTFASNRTQTHVFDLDFSTYTGALEGTYRIQIPGLGVSDPFPISEGAHSRVAQNAVAGYYHQLNGISLDGRFGYTRPAPFVDGVNGVAIYWSLLPSPFSSEQQLSPMVISSASGGAQPWLTLVRASGLYGSFMDAADWDSHVIAHTLSCYHLLDFCYEKLPSASRMTRFDFPKSSATLDPVLYAGSDFLPDAVHQALWYADFYRRTQDNSGALGLDGRVASGLGFDNGATVYPDGDGGSGGGGSGTFEPSWLSIDQPFLYAADEASNFCIAGLFAKIAIVFAAEAAAASAAKKTQRETDLSRVASTYTSAAIKAYSWAATLYADSGVGGARDAYYEVYLDLPSKASWSRTQYAVAMKAIRSAADGNGTGGPRAFAAGALYRLTHNGALRSVIESYAGQNGPYTDEGLWEYCFAHTYGRGDRSYNEKQSTALGPSGGWQVGARNDYVNYQESTPSPPYRILSFRAIDTRTALDRAVPVLLRAHIANRASGGRSMDFLRCLQAGQCYYYGANPLGVSFTVGIGSRYPTVVCHRDSEAMGVPPPKGLTVYGAGPNNAQSGGSSFANWSIDSDANFTAEFPVVGLTKMVEPYRYSVPVYEAFYENSYIIGCNEFTVEECILPRQMLAMWLHGWDNNVAP